MSKPLRLIARDGVLVEGELDTSEFYDLIESEEHFETAALASDAFASVFGTMRDLLRRGEPLRADGVENLRVAFDEYVGDLERKRMIR